LRSVMRQYFKLVCVFWLFLLAVSLSASANSNDSFSNVSLVGTSGKVSGSFTFNSSTQTFSNLTLSFNGGLFGGDSASNGGGKAKCRLGVCEFSWKEKLAGGGWVSDTILLNLKTGQYEDLGGIYRGKKGGDFTYMSVPEGGPTLSYLLLSGFVMLAGILITRKQGRARRTAQI
jgi:hypothetical protein